MKPFHKLRETTMAPETAPSTTGARRRANSHGNAGYAAG